MMYYPFGFDDNSFMESQYASRRSRAAQDEALLRKKMADVEARRRAEQERCYRKLAAQQEVEEERRHQEYMLQLQKIREEAEMKRQRQARARLLQQRQRAEEDQRLAYEAARQSQQSSYLYEDDSDQEDNEPEFHIVRGLDGCLYRMRNPSYHRRQKDSMFKRVRGPNGHLYRVKTENKKEADDMKIDTSFDKENVPSKSRSIPIITNNDKAMDVDSDVNCEVVMTKLQTPREEKNSTKGKRRKSKITVIVEDASDSEYEDDFNSPWRNRRPSPGEWLEPVDYFQ
jgi:hypothetical protein